MDKLLCLLEKYRCHLNRGDKSSTEFLRDNFEEYVKDVKEALKPEDNPLVGADMCEMVSEQVGNIEKNASLLIEVFELYNSGKIVPASQKAFKAVVDFSNRHPVLTGIVKAVGVAGLAAAADAVANGGRSNSGNGSSDDYSYTPSRSGSGSFNDYSDGDEVDTVDTYNSVERSSPEEHMVKGHGQHYHYKDGSVRWKEKDPYPRGGNKEE